VFKLLSLHSLVGWLREDANTSINLFDRYQRFFVCSRRSGIILNCTPVPAEQGLGPGVMHSVCVNGRVCPSINL
jgi:hypothetical protein